MCKAMYGLDHPTTAFTMSEQADLLRRIGEVGAARSAAERALSVLERRMDPSSYERAYAQVSLARVLLAQGELDRAGRLLDEALATHERSGCLGADALNLYEGYADYLRRRGRAAEAAQFDERARRARAKAGAATGATATATIETRRTEPR